MLTRRALLGGFAANVAGAWSATTLGTRVGRLTGGSSSTESGITNPVPRIGHSGLPWNSLVFGHGTAPEAFERWRRRPVDGVMYFPARATWDQMGQLPGRRSGDLVVYSIPPFPTSIGGSNAQVSAGAYDTPISALGRRMVAAGWNTDRTVIRLGWESNGSWYAWSWKYGGAGEYAAAFRRFVDRFRAAGMTKVRWDWCLNKGPQSYNSQLSWTAGYPGDAHVDVIGVDSYDMWTPTTTESSWLSNTTNKNPGLDDVTAFARAHGKQVALDEWGVTAVTGGGGDNPYYVARTLRWLKANADLVAWESVFDGPLESVYVTNLSTGTVNLKASAQYRAAYPNGWGRLT